MQETETFQLPTSGKEVIVRGYMTGYIDQEISRIVAGANKTSFEIDPEQVKAAEATGADPTPTIRVQNDPNAQIDANNKRLELMVSSLDGSTGDILNRVLSLPKQDVDFILAKIAAIEGESKVEGPDPKAPSN